MQLFRFVAPNQWLYAVTRRVPHSGIRRAREIADIMQEHSERIFYEKKAAVQCGALGLKEQLSDGKDIMSILRQSLVPLLYLCGDR